MGRLNEIRSDRDTDRKELLKASWERAKGTQHLEAKIGTFLKQDTEKLSKKERDARIDIAYRTASGSHVIIELKRASVATPVDRLWDVFQSIDDFVPQNPQEEGA